MFVQILKNQWFLITLLLAMAAGFWLAFPLEFLANLTWLKWSIVSLTMLLMTWPLETSRLLKVGARPSAPLIATTLNLVIAPLAAWPISKLLGDELGAGFLLAAAVPSTLASAAVWTRRAGGNDSIAIMVTIITNLLCFVVTPAWVFYLTGIEIPRELLVSTIKNLFLFVVLPMIVGQLLRISSKSAKWASGHKKTFSIFAQIGVLSIVLLGSINMRLRIANYDVDAMGANLILATLVAAVSLHLGILVAGMQIGRITGHSWQDQIAIGFSSSQKTLMVGLSTALNMGLNIFPIVAYHALQLIADTLVADYFQKQKNKDPSKLIK